MNLLLSRKVIMNGSDPRRTESHTKDEILLVFFFNIGHLIGIVLW